MGDQHQRRGAATDRTSVRRSSRHAGLILRTATAALLGERYARQGLAGDRSRSVAEAAALTGAIQAQDPPASRLGLRVRAAAMTDADVTAAITQSRTVVRTWLHRGTIHLVDTADLRWMVRLIGPSVARKYDTRWRRLGLTPPVRDTVAAALGEVLTGEPLTRVEIRDALDARGIRLESEDRQIHTHALVHASTTGLVCRGPDRGRTATFTLLDDWVPAAPAGPSGDAALAELARRYFAAFSPATAADFTTWSGLASARPLALIADELSPADVDGRPGFRLGTVEPARGLRLLPAFDNYVLGYREREAMLAAPLRPRIYEGGMIHPSVVRDGRVIGRWRLTSKTVEAMPFEPWPRTVIRAVEAEVADVARFVGRNLDPVVEPCG